MKRFKHIFGVILAVILTNLTTNVTAQDFSGYQTPDISVQNSRVNEDATSWLDSVDISLLTCGPGNEVWSYYGHSAAHPGQDARKRRGSQLGHVQFQAELLHPALRIRTHRLPDRHLQ